MSAHQDGGENIMVTLWLGNLTKKAATQFTCMDESVEQIPGSGTDDSGYRLYIVEANRDCGGNFSL